MTIPGLTFVPRAAVVTGMRVLAGAGLLTLIVGLIFAPGRVWLSLLILSFYLVGLALAGAVFVALLSVTGAAWGTALRRIPEAMASTLPLGAAGILAILFFYPELYAWTSGESAHGHMPVFRHFWLSLGFFRFRAVLFVVVWAAFIALLLRSSRLQDRDGEARHGHLSYRLSVAFLIAFGFTFWLASYDWIMSVEPEWYSTVFGMYNFAGMFLAGLAALMLLLLQVRAHKPFDQVFTASHLHDLGKLIFAFSTFWMYLWFCQYMLIWYANVPEESVYYVRRVHGYWAPLFLLNIVLNWVVPFLALLPRLNKQRPGVLTKVCAVLLVGRWLDLYLMVAPPYAPQPAVGVWELGLAAGAFGLFGLAFFSAFSSSAPVPLRDPDLHESLHYHA
jgi:hypothetical protein